MSCKINCLCCYGLAAFRPKKKPEKYPPESLHTRDLLFYCIFYKPHIAVLIIKKNICPGVVYKIKNKKNVIMFWGADLRCVHLN